MVQTCHNERSVQQTEDCREYESEVRCQSAIYCCSDRVTDLPADRSHDRVGDDDRRKEGTERNYDHADHFRTNLLKELLKVYKHEARHHCRDDLSLITDHLNLRETEIPHRDICRSCG